MTNKKIPQGTMCSENDVLELELETELSKPAEEIDTVLVTKILDALDIPEPKPEQTEASWQLICASIDGAYANDIDD